MKTEPLKCSFCTKVQEDVRKLISGPGDVYICDECIGICNEILVENDIRWNDRGVTPATDKHAKADDHLRAVEALIAAGEYKSAARLIRSSALYAISGLLDLAGEDARRIAHQARMAAIRDDDEPAGPDTYGWSAVALIRAVLHLYPNTQPMLQKTDRSHVILQLSLDGATIARDDAEQAFRALRDLVDHLKRQIEFATTTPRVGLPRPPGA